MLFASFRQSRADLTARVAVIVTLVAALFSVSACRGFVGVPDASAPPAPARRSEPSATPLTRWPIKTVEPVDLWLHAFALLLDDASTPPQFRRGYRDSLTVVKNRANVLTTLDTTRAMLAKRLLATPSYVQAQLLAFEFDSWFALRTAAERFVLAEGDDRKVSDRAPVEHFAQFARFFPTAADREWLSIFVIGVQDEQVRFFNAEHTRLVRTRATTITAVDSLWQRTYRARFDRFLASTGQVNGDVLLSIPIGGEGRVGVGRERQRMIAVPFPARAEDARQVILVLAHELSAGVVSRVLLGSGATSIQRSVAISRAISTAQVRAGAMLLERVAPELVEAYMQFYLTQSGVAVLAPALDATFVRIFDIPVAARDGMRQQIDIAVGTR